MSRSLKEELWKVFISKLNKNVTAALVIIINRKESSTNLQQTLKLHYDLRIDGYCVLGCCWTEYDGVLEAWLHQMCLGPVWCIIWHICVA